MSATVVIYTRSWCSYCRRAEKLLERKGVAFDNHDVSGDDAARAKLARETGRSTLPQIFINGRAVGGYDDIAALDRAGELDRLLAADPA